MKRSISSGGCWPSSNQELLLKAALMNSPESIRAWEQLKPKLNINSLDLGSLRILPLLYKNLKHQIDDPLFLKFKDYYQQTWLDNRVKFELLESILCLLHENNIKTMILKGSALIKLYYQDPGLRPMTDLDILVPNNQAAKAADLLMQSGWSLKFNIDRKMLSKKILVVKSWGFYNKHGFEIDLHWFVLGEEIGLSNKCNFWSKTEPVQLNSLCTQALQPEEQLFHIIIHGLRWNDLAPIRWVADSVIVLRSSDMDWDRLIGYAATYNLSIQLFEALTYLKMFKDVRIPTECLEMIKSIRKYRFERIDYKLKTTPVNSSPGPIAAMIYFYIIIARIYHSPSNKRLTKSLSIFLKYCWHLPFYLIYKVLRNGFRTV